MTCIVGVTHKGRVYMGGDSAGVSGLDLTVRKDQKVFPNGEFAIGFTSSFRMGQILQYVFIPPEIVAGESLSAFIVSRFIPAVRDTFKREGFTYVESSREHGGCFLVGVRGRLFQIDSDFQVGESIDAFAAIGCGPAYAYGSLHSTTGAPGKRIMSALEAAAHFSAGVVGPFNMVETAKGGECPPSSAPIIQAPKTGSGSKSNGLHPIC